MNITTHEMRFETEHAKYSIKYHGNENIIFEMTAIDEENNSEIEAKILIPRHILECFIEYIK
jgi:hypothetical protein